MLRTEKEVLRGGERKASFCTPLRPGEKEKRRKDGGDRHKKETFVLSNTGDRDIYNILSVCSDSFLSLLHSSLQPPKGGIIPPQRSVIACTYMCVTLHFVTLFKSFYMHYIQYHTNSTATFAKIIP